MEYEHDEDAEPCEGCGLPFDTENPDGPDGYYADGRHRRCYEESESEQTDFMHATRMRD